jgi:protein-disulfide isomerase
VRTVTGILRFHLPLPVPVWACHNPVSRPPLRGYRTFYMYMRSPRRILALALLGALGFAAAAREPDAQAARPAPQASADSAARARLARADVARIRGREDAPIWIVVISDFQCPFCKRWHEETAPLLERNYVRTGKARIAYLNYPVNTHRNAPPAHEFAMCAAEQDRFWPIADALFETQGAWKNLVDPSSFFDSLSSAAHLDRPRLRSCIASGEQRALIRADFDRSARIGVSSTPSFLIGGTAIVGAQPYEIFARAVDEALARRAAAAASPAAPTGAARP